MTSHERPTKAKDFTRRQGYLLLSFLLSFPDLIQIVYSQVFSHIHGSFLQWAPLILSTLFVALPSRDEEMALFGGKH